MSEPREGHEAIERAEEWIALFRLRTAEEEIRKVLAGCANLASTAAGAERRDNLRLMARAKLALASIHVARNRHRDAIDEREQAVELAARSAGRGSLLYGRSLAALACSAFRMGRPDASGIYRDACAALACAPGGGDRRDVLRFRWHDIRSSARGDFSAFLLSTDRQVRDRSRPLAERLEALSASKRVWIAGTAAAELYDEALARDPGNPIITISFAYGALDSSHTALGMAKARVRWSRGQRRGGTPNCAESVEDWDQALRTAIEAFESAARSFRDALPAAIEMATAEGIDVGHTVPHLMDAVAPNGAVFDRFIESCVDEAREVLAGREPAESSDERTDPDLALIERATATRALERWRAADLPQWGPLVALEHVVEVLELIGPTDPDAAIECIQSALPHARLLRDLDDYSGILGKFDEQVLAVAERTVSRWTLPFMRKRDTHIWRQVFEELVRQWCGQPGDASVIDRFSWGSGAGSRAIKLLDRLGLESAKEQLRSSAYPTRRYRYGKFDPLEYDIRHPRELLHMLDRHAEVAQLLGRALMRREQRFDFHLGNQLPSIPREWLRSDDAPIEFLVILVRQPDSGEDEVLRARSAVLREGWAPDPNTSPRVTEVAARLLFLRDHANAPIDDLDFERLMELVERGALHGGAFDLRAALLRGISEIALGQAVLEGAAGRGGLIRRLQRLRALVDRWEPEEGVCRLRLKHALFGAWYRSEVDPEACAPFAEEAERFVRAMACFSDHLGAEIDEMAGLPRVPAAIRTDLLAALARIGWSGDGSVRRELSGTVHAARRLLELGLPDAVERLSTLSLPASFLASLAKERPSTAAGIRSCLWQVVSARVQPAHRSDARRAEWHEVDGRGSYRADRDLHSAEFLDLIRLLASALIDQARIASDHEALAVALWEYALAIELVRRNDLEHCHHLSNEENVRVRSAVRSFLSDLGSGPEELTEIAEAIVEFSQVAADPIAGAVAIRMLIGAVGAGRGWYGTGRVGPYGTPQSPPHLGPEELARISSTLEERFRALCELAGVDGHAECFIGEDTYAFGESLDYSSDTSVDIEISD